MSGSCAAHPADGHYPDPVMTALPISEDQPPLPLEAPGVPDDDPLPPAERPLP